MFDRDKQSDAEIQSLAERFQRFAARQRAPGKLPRDPFTERGGASEHAAAPPRLSDLFGGRSSSETTQLQAASEPAARKRPDAASGLETGAHDEGSAHSPSASEPPTDLHEHEDGAPSAGDTMTTTSAPDEPGHQSVSFGAGDEPAASEFQAQGTPPASGDAAAPWQPWSEDATKDPWQWQARDDHDEAKAWTHHTAQARTGDAPAWPVAWSDRSGEASEDDNAPGWIAPWQNDTGNTRDPELGERGTPPTDAPRMAAATPWDHEQDALSATGPDEKSGVEEDAGDLSATHRDDAETSSAPQHAAPMMEALAASAAVALEPAASLAEPHIGDDDRSSATAAADSALYKDEHDAGAALSNADLLRADEATAPPPLEEPPAMAPWSPPTDDAESAATGQRLFFTPPRRSPSAADTAHSDPWESTATPFAPPPARQMGDDNDIASPEQPPISVWPATDGFQHDETARPVRPPAAEEFVAGATPRATPAGTTPPAEDATTPGFAAFARRWQEEHRSEIARPLTLHIADEPERPRGLFARLRRALFGSGGAALGDTAIAFEPEEEQAEAREKAPQPAIPPSADEQPRERVASLRYSVMQREEEEDDGFATGVIARMKRHWFRETPDPLTVGAGLAIAIAVGLVLIGVLFRHGSKPEVQTSSNGPAVAETSAPATASAVASPISAFRAPTLAPVPSVTPLAIAPLARAAQATPVPPSATVPVPTTVPVQTPAPPPLTRPARTATFVPPQVAAGNNGSSSLPSLVGNASTNPSGALSASAPPPAASAPVYTSGSGSVSGGATARYAPVSSSSGSSGTSPAAAAQPSSPPDVGAALSDAAAAAARAAAAAAQRAGGSTSTSR